jgi:glutathione gamma-glutamylcysteinyltransferase
MQFDAACPVATTLSAHFREVEVVSAITRTSLYRRPLPEAQIPFSSEEGRRLFREALTDGTMEGFFPLIEQFHTQADPAFCGLASLVVALNALGIDPGRLWRGPWRWFSEELLDCCTPLEQVRLEGVSMTELACLSRCNGADAQVRHAAEQTLEQLRASIERAARSATDDVVIASYSRAPLGQTGSGHFSPIGGYHRGRDLALLLDVARFKYPPHWVSLESLFQAMREPDPAMARSRGWVELRRRGAPSSVAFFISCRDGIAIGSTISELVAQNRAALRAEGPNSARQALRAVASAQTTSKLASCVELRQPRTPEHQQLFEELACSLRGSRIYKLLEQEGASAPFELSAAWLLAAPEEVWSDLSAEVMNEVAALLDLAALPELLRAELLHVRAQIEFLLEHARESREEGVRLVRAQSK